MQTAGVLFSILQCSAITVDCDAARDCTLQTGHKRSQNKAWTHSQPGEKHHVKDRRILLSDDPQQPTMLCFNPSFRGVALETEVELFYYLRRGEGGGVLHSPELDQ